MANDRMYLRCLGCNEWLAVAKHMGGEWYGGPSISQCTLGPNLLGFLHEHSWCEPVHKAVVFAYETDDDWNKWFDPESKYKGVAT